MWLSGDPVHLTPAVYTAVGKALSTQGNEELRRTKRAGLESEAAQVWPPSKRGGAPVRLPDWLSGRHGPIRGRGAFRVPYGAARTVADATLARRY